MDQSLETKPAAHLAALTFALFFPTLGAWMYFVQFAGHPLMTPTYVVTKVIQFAFPFAWILLVQRRTLRLQRPDASGFLPGLAFGAMVAAAMFAVYFGVLRDHPAMAEAGSTVSAKLAGVGCTTPIGFLGIALFYCLGHSLLEEMYWRWFVFHQLDRITSPIVAGVVSSIGFTLHHIILLASYFDNPLAVAALSLGITIGGAFWAWLYRRTGTLYACWASHLLVDAALMTIGYDLVF